VSEPEAAPSAGERPAALILAGGSGTRFWPLSRRSRPKQLLALEAERTLLQATFDRLRPLVDPDSIWVSTTRELVREVRRQLPQVAASQVVVEPEGRNTGPAIAWALYSMPEALRRGPVAVLPADHRVGDPHAFRAVLADAFAAAAKLDLVITLGVVPRWPETGFGYLRLGAALPGGALRRVSRFVEKPSASRARHFVRSGSYLWNAGIFVFRGTTLLRLLKRLQPEMAAGLAELAAAPDRLAELYPRLPSLSIDHAVMERLRSLATLPLDCGWSDLGSWAALAEVRPKDDQGNAVRGDVVAVDAVDNLLYAERGTIAVVGVSGLVVVRTSDSVLVVPMERAQDVRRVIAELEARGRYELV
jgi:mannose-1-phosphate guanylyltransferase